MSTPTAPPSLLRSLLTRTSSIASPRADRGEEQSSVSPLAMRSVPSFNDFSCGIQADAEDTEMEAATPSAAGSFSPFSRHSMDSTGSPSSYSPGFLARRSLDLRADMKSLFSSATTAGPETIRTTPSVPIPPANQHKSASGRSQPTDQAEQRKRSARQKKIDGMEFYEWAELIRSSSL
ncbi:hypothetical protein COCOBI_07-4120 [Coccomyxa sp. Obi]|nr:hypothetical protein COCOBI_07-4120 [Coccomyxa sp. Obi]